MNFWGLEVGGEDFIRYRATITAHVVPKDLESSNTCAASTPEWLPTLFLRVSYYT